MRKNRLAVQGNQHFLELNSYKGYLGRGVLSTSGQPPDLTKKKTYGNNF